MTSNFDDDEFNGVPLPPEDRLWRHPSELRHLAGASASATPTPAPTRAAPRVARTAPRRSWGVVVAAALAGGSVVGALWFTLGAISPRTVYVTERVPVQPLDSTPPRLVSPEDWAEQVAISAWPSLARVELDDGPSITGIVIRDDGLLVTAAGPLGNEREVTVSLPDGETVRATVLGIDPLTDIAVLNVDAENLIPALLSRDHVMQETDSVAVVGTAGNDAFVERSEVELPGPVLRSDSGFHPDLTPLGLTQAAPGSAVLDESGAVVAVVTSLRQSANSFAVPIDTAREIALTIAARDQVTHDGWIGVDVRSLDQYADADPLVRSSVQVSDLVPGGPAAAGGLRIDDIIASIDGRTIGDRSVFATLERSLAPGQVVTLEVWRFSDGLVPLETVMVEVELGARPAR